MNDKININIRFDFKFENYLRSVNSALVQRASSVIDFSVGAQPHMTLIMGNANPNQYATIFQEVKQIVMAAAERPVLRAGRPYLRDRISGYVFVDLLDDSYVIQLKYQMWKNTKHLIQPSRHGGPKNKPHITVGKTNDLIEHMQLLEYNSAVSIHSIRVSSVGQFGTCHETLSEYNFNSSN